MQDHNKWMKKALSLADKAISSVSPNPAVGCVIVKNNKLLSWGYHKKAGKNHAEVDALEKLSSKVRQASLYVTLEPCFHFGKTPPCVDKIIEYKKQIKEVVIACKDPNPLTKGKSITKLKKNGFKVTVGVLEKEAAKLNEVFFKNMKEKMPFVVVKSAQSLDGKTVTRKGHSKWITSEKSRKYVKVLRDNYDSILVGINTVLKDNPTLNGAKKKLIKVVIDSSLKIPLNSTLVKDYAQSLIVVCSDRAGKNKKSKLLKKGAELIELSKENNKFNLKSVLKKLYAKGICSVFVEGGATTSGLFFDAKLVDKVYFFYAPMVIGGKAACGAVYGNGVEKIIDSANLVDVEIERIDCDILITGYPQYRG